jgi:DNA-binding protein HU-beta
MISIGGVMHYDTIVKNLAEKLKQPQTEIRRLLQICFKVFIKTLDTDKAVSIPKLGTFQTETKEERKAYSPYYKKFMHLPRKRVITYHASSVIKRELKDKKVENA